MLKRIGSATFIAVKLSLIIDVLLLITLCCDVSVSVDLSSCSAYDFPSIVLSPFVCPQAVNVNAQSVKKQIAFMFVIGLLSCRPTISANEQGLAMVGHLKNVSPTFAQKPNSSTNVEFSTSAPLLPNRC